MSVDARLNELRQKHESLSKQVDEAQRHPGIDDLEITSLKKQKLRIKEEISRLTRA